MRELTPEARAAMAGAAPAVNPAGPTKEYAIPMPPDEPQKSDWELPFPDRFLACADAMAKLEHWLMVVGMSGNTHFKALQAEFIKHGGMTFHDMKRG